MSWIPAVGAAALKYGPAALAAFQGLRPRPRKKIDWAALQAWMATIHPEGYVTPEDVVASEQTRARLAASAVAGGVGMTAEVLRRARQRGVGGAPAEEAALARVGQTVARGRQGAGDTAEQQLYNVRLGNQRFEQQKALGLISGRIGSERENALYGEAASTEALNSLLDYVPSLTQKTTDLSNQESGAPGATPAQARVYDPTTGTFVYRRPRSSAFRWGSSRVPGGFTPADAAVNF